ncbi:MAG: ion transporter, partial [Myxococcota bacterium]|nr:ion transporter [Myxococcota bacterium]
HWKARLHEVIFEADTPKGKAFDVLLFVAILGSVIVVSLESVARLDAKHHDLFVLLEWGFTLVFTVEYVLRLSCVGRPSKYALSFFGIVDLLAILPTYLGLLFPGVQTFLVIRALRLLRVFRVFKLTRMLGEATALKNSLYNARSRIAVFLTMVGILVAITGATLYVIEGPEAGFTSIPVGMYWAVVTLTTVGYGDIAPQTALGQSLAALLMIMGYSLIVVPTSIITAEMTRTDPISTQACPECSREGHDRNAIYCKYCSAAL